MNIQRTVRSQPSRAVAQKAYEEAQQKEVQAEAAHWEKYDTYMADADRVAFRAGLGTGVAITGTLLGLAAAGLTPRPLSGEALVAVVSIGAALGMGVGAGVQVLGQRRGSKDADATTRPAMLQSREESRVAREQFRDSLISEMNDEGVVQETTDIWNTHKAAESDAYSWGAMKEASSVLANELGNLTLLADGRQANGWLGELANLEDNPADFKLQKETIEAHPSLLQMVQA
jgi:hypothetical protein